MNPTDAGPGRARPAWRTLAFFAVGGGAVIFASSVGWTLPNIAAAAAAAGETRPYLLLAGLATALVWALPGLALVVAFGNVQRASQAVLLGFPLAYGIHVGLASLQHLMGSGEYDPGLARTLATLAALVALMVYLVRVRRTVPEGSIASTARGPGPDTHFALCALSGATVMLFLFCAKTFAENLNDDGLEALYIGQSLTAGHLPRFPTDSGLVGVGVGMFSQAWLTHWFGAWFGFGEAAPRLPFLLGFVLCLAALVELIEHGSPRRLRVLELIGVSLGLMLFALVIGTSAGYDPYFCELSSPGAYELFLLGCVLGGYAAWLQGNHVALFTYVLLAHLARPTGLLLFLMLGAAMFVVGLRAGAERRRQALRIVPGFLACVGFSLVYEKLYAPWALGGEALPYGAGSILERFHFLTFTDLERVAWGAVACGLVPFASLVFWKRLDSSGRAIALVCAGYLALFYVPAFVSLHHYAPLMVLPLVPFWRGQLAHGWGSEGRTLAVAGAGLVLGTWLSWPASFTPDRSLADFGARIVDGREAHAPAEAGARDHARILDSLSLLEEPGVDPAERFVCSSWNLEFYARPDEDEEQSEVSFRVLAKGQSPPDGWERRATRGEVVLWAAPGAEPDAPPLAEFGARLYRIPREVLFRHLGIPAEAYDWSPRKSLAGW